MLRKRNTQGCGRGGGGFDFFILAAIFITDCGKLFVSLTSAHPVTFVIGMSTIKIQKKIKITFKLEISMKNTYDQEVDRASQADQ